MVDGSNELITAERSRGLFSREIILGDNLDTDRIEADYSGGVLHLLIPVAEKAKLHKITICAERPESLQSGRFAT
jgi:HSP20 family protein